jgi:hypothetical protein
MRKSLFQLARIFWRGAGVPGAALFFAIIDFFLVKSFDFSIILKPRLPVLGRHGKANDNGYQRLGG